ncbi:DUF6063 family protein [Salisediminibacterium beveridgei]|uniref:Non-ribosomal peptide synthetase module n=1 Tax=Salisediminibacterium beveridgei TaxID=632773 RepID=A0A1D7QS28_9BACI|nr:DUF6063 family protein [Salisediminibacterium beveridgei]AOM81799.1 hypothetical protein BBEV_0405 [Salisediminibacterium beveridgei]
MQVKQDAVEKAFRMYVTLARSGYSGKDDLNLYLANDEIRELVDDFAGQVECVTLVAGEQLYMIPRTKLSPFHVDNNHLKKTYLHSRATNDDLYLLYFATLVLIGEFYDGHQSREMTRDFVPKSEWVERINERIESLSGHGEEQLKSWEEDYRYHWRGIIEKWQGMDDVRETAKKQAGNTISRLSFLDTVRRFLLDQEIARDIGNGEITLTEKAKIIVQRFFMDADMNQELLEFIYSYEAGDEKNEEESRDAIDQ